MARLIQNAEEKSGTEPGTLFVQNASTEVNGFYIQYNASHFTCEQIQATDLKPDIKHSEDFVHWYHFEGFGREEFFNNIKSSFNLPSLQLADILNTDHHPKFEDLKDQLFFLMKNVHLNETAKLVEYNHLGLFVGEDYVLTFCERPTNVFEYVIRRLERSYGKIREQNEDFLFYSLIDAVVDKYLAVVERLGNNVEELEVLVANQQRYEKNLTKDIYRLRTEFLMLQKLILPIRESIRIMINHQDTLFDCNLNDYLNDLKDHIEQITNAASSYRDMASDLLNIYATNIDLRTNKVLTFLTVYSTIFIPLTFITGLYGMNFKFMPELDERYAYPIVWLVMISISVGMLIFFKKKKLI
ncbi:MAG: magnesium and cobalt transport protein CorA [Halobacteriovoraceae bacterium]|nr:magnesium and cobalt transport protein CorA [Halobacteriovoraceae bacterium]|tara:strand:- start:86622 stop:87689 length:1068 start_codon:yes stop_codon:yes gene_type:complete